MSVLTPKRVAMASFFALAGCGGGAGFMTADNGPRVDSPQPGMQPAPQLQTPAPEKFGKLTVIPRDPLIRMPLPEDFTCPPDSNVEKTTFAMTGTSSIRVVGITFREGNTSTPNVDLRRFVDAAKGVETMYAEAAHGLAALGVLASVNDNPRIEGDETLTFRVDNGDRLDILLPNKDPRAMQITGGSVIYQGINRASATTGGERTSRVIIEAAGDVTVSADRDDETGILGLKHYTCERKPDSGNDGGTTTAEPGKDRGDIGDTEDPDAGTSGIGQGASLQSPEIRMPYRGYTFGPKFA